MNLKVAASLALAIIAAPSLSMAAPQTWYIHHGSLEDSGVAAGTVTGSFDYDADTNSYSNIDLQYRSAANVLIQTYDAVFSPQFSGNNASNLNAYPSGTPTNTRPAIYLTINSPMTSATGNLLLNGGSKVYTCDSTFPNFCNVNLDSLYFSSGALISTSPTPPPATPVSVPTMTEWAMILLTIMLGGAAAITINRRRQAV